MSIHIQEVKTNSDLKIFIYLPEKIHKHHKNWVHPLYMDDEVFFNSKKNPAFKHSETILLLAFEGQKPVGRIMGIVPSDFNAMKNVQTARFAYLECEENKEVFDALLKAVEKWATLKGCDQMIGPMGFSDKEPQGFLTQGLDEKTMIVTNCSFGFMTDFIVANQYQPYVELCQYDVPLNDGILKRYAAFSNRVLKNQNIKVHEFSKRSEVKPFVKGVFELVNTTYTDIYGFTKVTVEEADEFANRFLPILNPKLIKILTSQDDKVIAFVIAMPDLSKAIKKSRGRMLPLGWLRILLALKNSKRLVLLLGAVQNEMQNKGLDAVLAVKLIGSALQLGFTEMDSHLIMKENTKMRREIERLEHFRLYKEYSIYKKELKN